MITLSPHHSKSAGSRWAALQRAWLRARRVGAGALLATAVWACGGANTPERAARDLADALEGEDYSAAYAMLSRDHRRQLSYERFEREMRANRHESLALAATLQQSEVVDPIRANATLSDGSQVELVFEEGHWRIASETLDFYSQSTAERALRSFARAARQGRYDVMLRFVPEADRAGMTPEAIEAFWQRPEMATRMMRLLERVDEVRAGDLERVGSARMIARLPQGGAVRLVLEDGLWKVEGIDE